MFKVRELKFHDIYLSVPYQGQQINCVLTTGIKDGSGLYVIVPGLFGDRTDSRHMFWLIDGQCVRKYMTKHGSFGMILLMNAWLYAINQISFF